MVRTDPVVPPAEVNISLAPLLSEANTPDGPENDNETVESKPLTDATYRPTVPADPCGIDTDVFESPRAKSPVAVWANTPPSDNEASAISKTTASTDGTNPLRSNISIHPTM